MAAPRCGRPPRRRPCLPGSPPAISASLQDLDFWLTDEHADDNTQQALIEIADGAGVLEHYDADVRRLLDSAKNATTRAAKAKFLSLGCGHIESLRQGT